jgi:hypothetical protein
MAAAPHMIAIPTAATAGFSGATPAIARATAALATKPATTPAPAPLPAAIPPSAPLDPASHLHIR